HALDNEPHVTLTSPRTTQVVRPSASITYNLVLTTAQTEAMLPLSLLAKSAFARQLQALSSSVVQARGLFTSIPSPGDGRPKAV
ncbi:hypothetical protein HaLaN_20493, partial [Haematococcus lacustris]